MYFKIHLTFLTNTWMLSCINNCIIISNSEDRYFKLNTSCNLKNNAKCNYSFFLHISFNNVQKIFSTPNHFHFSLHLEKKIASKEGNHTTEIIERERKKEKKKRAKGAFLIFIHLCRKLRNSVPGRWLTKGSILIIDFHGFAERQKIVCGESHLNTTMGGSYTINNGEGSRIVSSVIIHPPPPPRNQLAIPSSELWKLKHKGHFQSPMLCYSASFPDR